MNIVADQLNSKPNTQAMLSCFLNDMKEYFQKSPSFSEDKTYARILKIAETTQKCLPQSYSISNIALKLVQILKQKIDDKLQDEKLRETQPQTQNSPTHKEQLTIHHEDIEGLDHLLTRLSRETDSTKIATRTLGREINQEFMKKLVVDSIEDLRDQIDYDESSVMKYLGEALNPDSHILFMDSRLSNKNAITKVANQKRIKVTHVKTSGADPKNNEINLIQVAGRIRKYNKAIITAESILKNGAIVAEPGSLIIALAAKKYNIPVIALTRGFCLTEKVMIDQHFTLAENPMKYFEKTENGVLKTYVAKKFDLIDGKLVNLIVDELGIVNPANIELHFSQYYDYN